MAKNNDPIKSFRAERAADIRRMSADKKLKKAGMDFFIRSAEQRYSYHFEWLGRPIIQYPQDIVALQEIIWNVKPDLIIETGIAHGGSIIFSASMLELLGGRGQVIGIDVDIRKHNRREIEKHPMFKRIKLIEGSSIAPEVVARVKKMTKGKKRIMVIFDSNHSHDHVLGELNAYASLVTKGSYCVVFDTVIDDMPRGANKGRPWDKGSNPKTAVKEFLKDHKEFRVDAEIENKIVITVGPGGFLKRIA